MIDGKGDAGRYPLFVAQDRQVNGCLHTNSFLKIAQDIDKNSRIVLIFVKIL